VKWQTVTAVREVGCMESRCRSSDKARSSVRYVERVIGEQASSAKITKNNAAAILRTKDASKDCMYLLE
jgi:hypothetical protein